MSIHEPVLLHEVVSFLGSAKNAPWYLDGTLGGAGHALAIAKAYGGKLKIIGLDRNQQTIQEAETTLKGKAEQVILKTESFRNLDRILAEIGSVDHAIKLDLILLDLGISSDELDNSGRGFTFQKDEPLLMTMGDPKDYAFTARDIVNDWEESNIADIIYAYGEERYSRRIAKAIVTYRLKKKIETSGELAELIKLNVPFMYKRGKIHPATRTFQALRIAVNDELNALKEGLVKGYAALAPQGRMAVISFHSLEDRIVKDHFKKFASEEKATILTKKPVTASLQEIAENPRSRSAKLRVIEKN